MSESKYIEFFKVASLPKTDVYNILSKRSEFILGQIKWFGRWRTYCFFPASESVFNNECLKDIQNFIGELNLWHRKGGR